LPRPKGEKALPQSKVDVPQVAIGKAAKGKEEEVDSRIFSLLVEKHKQFDTLAATGSKNIIL
jgi:hypothetical protein